MKKLSLKQELALAMRERKRAAGIVDRLESRQLKEIFEPDMKRNIGKCFKFRNNYSSAEFESDYWWEYVRIVSVKQGRYITVKFWTDSRGESKINPANYVYVLPGTSAVRDDYIPITKKEFENASREFLSRIARTM